MKQRVASMCVAVVAIAFAGHAASATYYIDNAAGNDANNGTSTASPWQRSPGMNGFTGAYSHAAGDRFIFKGGVTWPASVFEMAIAYDGVNGNPDYYGVDQSWYTGGTWTRPVFDGQHAALGTGENLVNFSNRQYVTLDNIELKRHRSVGNWGIGSIALYCSQYILLTNLYVHDWSLDPAITTDDAHGGIIGNYPACPTTGTWIDGSTISNAEAGIAGRANGIATRLVNVRNSVIHDVSSAMLFGYPQNTTIYNVAYPAANIGFDANYHANVTYVENWTGAGVAYTPAYVYGNVIYDVGAGSGALYPNACGADQYYFNNVLYNIRFGNPIQIEPYGGVAGCGSYYIWNNTIADTTDSGFAMMRIVNRGFQIGTLDIRNNHFIYTGSDHLDDGPGSTNLINSNNIDETVANAATQGYIVANLFAPTDDTDSSVTTTGINHTAQGITALNVDRIGIDRPAAGDWNIGAYQFTDEEPPPDPPPANVGPRNIVLASAELYTDVFVDSPSGSRTLRRLTLGENVPGIARNNAAAVEGLLGFRQTRLTLTNAVLPVADNGAAGGNASVKLYTFPPGAVFIPGATASVSIVGGAGLTATAAVVAGVGTAAAAADNGTLTLTEADVVASTGSTLADSAGIFYGKSTATEMAAGIWDGTTSQVEIYLNFAVPDAGITAPTTITVTGTIMLSWTNLGDI